MQRSDPRLVESGPIPYLLSLPANTGSSFPLRPLLCFLHGYKEGAPTPIVEALTLHGPLAPTSSSKATTDFIVVAPQLPIQGDLWHKHADSVYRIVQEVQASHQADPARTYLTGFSYGGNGVFDLALKQRDTWAAIWPVDPTRVPERDPGLPIWLSSGEISRNDAETFIQRLDLKSLTNAAPGDRVYLDQNADHVETARLAYQDERIYQWLLLKSLSLSS